MRSVAEWLEINAQRDAAALALVHGAVEISYGELLDRAKVLGRGLAAAGLKPGQRVAVLMRKSCDAVVALHAVLRSGCAYVPLDPNDPTERLLEALDVCRPNLAIVDREGELPAVTAKIEAFRVGRLEALAKGASDRSRVDALEAPAAVLRTSGSTGKPKGVVISNRNLAAFIAWAVSAFQVTPADRLLSHAPLEFDLSFFDLYVACAAGAATVLSTPRSSSLLELGTQVNTAAVTIWQSVPSAITLIAEALQRGVEPMPTVRAVLFAGERMPRKTLLACSSLFPNARLFNVYGATETNDTFIYAVPKDVESAPDPLPIGEPLPFVEYRIVDDEGHDVAPGESGQLLVSAPTVSLGYLHAGRELELAPVEFPTRDVCSIGDDGQVRFLGRTDSVIKSNGFRVNTLEVEDQLRRLDAVEEAAVVAVPDATLGTRMIAVIRLRDGGMASTLELKVFCANRLPSYAIPHRFEITREALPTNSNGKVDKRTLSLRFS
jgi:amino acid adenylation domain-containing protein